MPKDAKGATTAKDPPATAGGFTPPPMPAMFRALAAPFHPNDLEWRLQTSGEKGGKPWALVLAYITNRAIQERLDVVIGPHLWRNEFTRAPEGGILCGLSIRVGDEWITKWDGAENTDVEAVKGGLSGAMKRAAVQWGIGRYLYGLDETFASVSDSGRFRGKTKDGTVFRWDPPKLPTWALPEGLSPEEAAKAGRAAGAAHPEPPAPVHPKDHDARGVALMMFGDEKVRGYPIDDREHVSLRTLAAGLWWVHEEPSRRERFPTFYRTAQHEMIARIPLHAASKALADKLKAVIRECAKDDARRALFDPFLTAVSDFAAEQEGLAAEREADRADAERESPAKD